MVGFGLVWANALKVFGEHVEYIHLAPILGAVLRLCTRKVE